MRLKNIIESLNQAIVDERMDNHDKKSIIASVVESNFEIEIEMDMYFNKKVSIVNPNSDNNHDYSNVESYLCENTFSWNESEPTKETIWTLNGFADERDYLRYRYG